MKKLILALSVALFCASSQAQTNSTPLLQSIVDVFDLHNTNGLVSAKEIDLNFYAGWQRKERFGAGFDLCYWFSDQQGGQIGFFERAKGEVADWKVGYGARTIFGQLEVHSFTGIKQNVDEGLGDVRIYIQPGFAWRIPKIKSDVRIFADADISAGHRPGLLGGVSWRFGR